MKEKTPGKPEDKSAGEAGPTPKMVPCPQCRKPAPWQGNPYRPFCSERCQLIDRGAWAEGSYAIPGEDSPGIDDGDG